MMLKKIFYQLAFSFTDNWEVVNKFWYDIEQAYTQNRHYHTLQHLQQMLDELMVIKNNFSQTTNHKPAYRSGRPQTTNHISRPDALLFALFYHDIVYIPGRKDNEEKSAEVAKEHLQILNVPALTIATCTKMIKATKNHLPDEDPDVNYFTDADLSVLGQPEEKYEIYRRQVRMEYAFLSDEEFNAGRRTVLKQFLAMENIFKTEHFRKRFEKKARGNIGRELGFVTH